uniref:Uncharacterized protein n=1 Tax=Rhizophora mucronata TaxID=61149 RepID=A0A2P2PLY2_RHIMU
MSVGLARSRKSFDFVLVKCFLHCWREWGLLDSPSIDLGAFLNKSHHWVCFMWKLAAICLVFFFVENL